MQPEEWEALYEQEARRLMDERGYSEQRARLRARELTELRHGHRPRRVKEVFMNGKASPVPSWVLAIVFAVLAGLGAAELALADDVISNKEWISIAIATLGMGVAKYSNPEKVFSPRPTVKQ